MDSGNRGNLGMRVGVGLALVALLMGSGVFGFMKLKAMKKPAEQSGKVKPRTAVQVDAAVRGPYQEFLRGYGSARALRRADVAAEVSAQVLWVSKKLEAGTYVSITEELVRLDRGEYEVLMRSAVARMQQAEAAQSRLAKDLENIAERLVLAREDLATAERELARVADLVNSGVSARSDLDRQRLTQSLSRKEVLQLTSQEDSTREEQARVLAEIASAQATIDKAKLDLKRTSVKPPYGGTVEVRQVNEGARVSPGTLLFTIVDRSEVEIPVSLGAAHYGEVPVGAKAKVWFDGASEPTWTGTVSRISPGLNAADRTFLVYLVVRGNPGPSPIPPGAFVLAEIEGRKHEQVIPVPREAFLGESLFVALREGDEAVIHRKTPVVSRFLPKVALVTGGLEPGELVVVTNLEQIAEKSRVVIVDGADEERESGR